MKIHGDKKIFAIQWEFDSYHAPYCYGYFCFWINGERVGNYEEISTLSIIASFLSDFINCEKGHRYHGSTTMTKEELFHLVYFGFFDGSFTSTTSHYKMHELSAKHWLDEVGEYSFRDKIGMILIDEPELVRERIIWSELNNGIVKEFFIPEGCFEKVGLDFLDGFSRDARLS